MESDIIEDDIDGVIHSIHVRNFFCHDNLEINLNKNVNFIVGRNGSGKSAILTALVVGLGGRASATNRGSSLQSFIKKGSNSATVEIKIKNNSVKAYKPHIYGDHITIIRTINASGGSSYKIKSNTGELISTKFEEVNAITLAHDIQVDNPISVLNQDDARSFHASDAKKKYSLFRKATNLDQTETNYMRALENCNKANAIWKRKNDAMAELEKEYKKWKTTHEQLQSRDEMETKKQELQNEYYWSEIADLERNLASVQTQYDKQKAKIERLMDKLNKMTEQYGSTTDTIDALKQQLTEKSAEKQRLEQELKEFESQVREVQGAWRAAQNASGKKMDLFNREKRKMANLEKEIESIESGSAASQRGKLESAAAEARAAASAARARYDTAQHEAEQARSDAAHSAAQSERAAASLQRRRAQLQQLRQQVRELESRGHDSLAVYGPNMVELKQRVAASKHLFSAEPRGPVGSYLKVKEKKWGGALEHIIGGSIQSFCVNTPEDSRKLFQIMEQVYGKAAKPSVTCSKFLSARHDVSRSKVRAGGFVCALDALHVQDPVVANFLIDHAGLEAVLLVAEHEDAVRLSDNEENVPENCSKIVTLDSSEYYPAPNYRSYGGSARPSRYLHLSTAERKRQVQTEIAEQEASLRSAESEAESLENAHKSARAHERSAAQALQALLDLMHQTESAARTAEAALDRGQAPHHAVLVDELNICKEAVGRYRTQLEELAQQERQHKARVDELDRVVRATHGDVTRLATACRLLNEEIEHEQLKMERGVSERQDQQRQVAEERSKLTAVDDVLAERRAALDGKVRDALTLCPRIDAPRDLAIVTSELKKTQLKLRSISADGLSKQQVTERLVAVQRRYRRANTTLNKLKALIEEIKSTTDKHLKFCHSVQTYIARRVQHCFQSILTLRGYSGSMHIDNAAGSLDVQCTGRERGGARHAHSTASLSGGERSYSTVAFIMALWDCVELPFHLMDEFDVFMDNVNRKVVMELLLDHALKNPARQYVFLTPQDTSAVSAGPAITIHLMADPRN